MVYDIPGSSFGPRWLTHGWEMTSKMQFHTGLPFTAFASYDTSGTGDNTTRGVQVGNPYVGVNHTQGQGQPVQWINPDAFVNPAQGSFGTVGRNTLRGPGYGDVDLAFLKNIPVKERLQAQLRIELFNIFNRVEFSSAQRLHWRRVRTVFRHDRRPQRFSGHQSWRAIQHATGFEDYFLTLPVATDRRLLSLTVLTGCSHRSTTGRGINYPQ